MSCALANIASPPLCNSSRATPFPSVHTRTRTRDRIPLVSLVLRFP